MKRFLSTVAVGAIALLVACDKPAPEVIITPVKVELVESLASDVGLTFSAQVVPQTQVDVAFRTDGYVSAIKMMQGVEGEPRLLQPGDAVQEGDILANVKDEQYQDQVTKAQANLDKARAAALKGEQDFRRAQALNKTQSITAPDFDAAQKEYSSANAAVVGAQAQLDEANLKLAETALIVPLGGIVQQRNIELGSLVHKGSVGFVVANTSTVKVVFGVPDTMLSDIALGATLAIHTESLPNRQFNGTVTEIEPAADQRTRIFEVSVQVENTDGALRPGMVASLDVSKTMLAAGQVVVVPITAVVATQGGGFGLYTAETAEDGSTVARLNTVETGQILGNRITVTSGVSVGAKVVVTGAALISDKQPINIVP